MFVLSLPVSSGAMLIPYSCPYPVRMHTPTRPSPDVMGLSSGFWCTLKRAVCYRTVIAHSRRCHEFSEV